MFKKNMRLQKTVKVNLLFEYILNTQINQTTQSLRKALFIHRYSKTVKNVTLLWEILILRTKQRKIFLRSYKKVRVKL